MKKRSLKKSLAAIGTLELDILAAYVIYKDPTQAANIFWPMIVYHAALFGIKKFGQYFNDKEGE